MLESWILRGKDGSFSLLANASLPACQVMTTGCGRGPGRGAWLVVRTPITYFMLTTSRTHRIVVDPRSCCLTNTCPALLLLSGFAPTPALKNKLDDAADRLNTHLSRTVPCTSSVHN